MYSEKILARVTRTFVKPAIGSDRKWARKFRHKVTAELHQLGGNEFPYFSVTVDSERQALNNRWTWDSGGCQHELALSLWPELTPIVALHLSDYPSGAPMHAASNAFYWLAGACGGLGERYHGGNSTPAYSPEKCLEVFANHCRVTIDEARVVKERAQQWGFAFARFHEGYTAPGLVEMMQCESIGVKQALFAWIETQKERWKREAQAGFELLQRWETEKKERLQREGFITQ